MKRDKKRGKRERERKRGDNKQEKRREGIINNAREMKRAKKRKEMMNL